MFEGLYVILFNMKESELKSINILMGVKLKSNEMYVFFSKVELESLSNKNVSCLL